MRLPIVILSDLHLGARRGSAGTAADLAPLLDRAATLVINGDLAEVHHPRHRAAAARETLALFDLCYARNIELRLLSGNHDPFLSDHRFLLLRDGQVLVTHGDAFHPAIAPWSPAAPRMRRTHDAALARLTPAERGDLETRLAISQHAAYAEWSASEDHAPGAEGGRPLLALLRRPWLALHVLAAWHRNPRLADAFADRFAPQARFVIVGHTHRPHCAQVGGRWIINTGAFGFPGRPFAAVLDDTELHFVRLVRRAAGWTMAAHPARAWTLDAAGTDLAADLRPGDALPEAATRDRRSSAA
ncbi:MAG: metallophosphoesterase family protein [Phycisphaeraceae bacterium]|nr:metallophosphoesterase family protein [Phycisphaeraceae bacterium]